MGKGYICSIAYCGEPAVTIWQGFTMCKVCHAATDEIVIRTNNVVGAIARVRLQEKAKGDAKVREVLSLLQAQQKIAIPMPPPLVVPHA